MPETHTLDGLDVTVADGILDRNWGWRGRRDVSGEALVLAWPTVADRGVDMFGVRTPLDVVWLVDRVVTHTAWLTSWTGQATALANQVVELPAGTIGDWGIETHDRVEVPA